MAATGGTSVSIRELGANEWRVFRDLRLRALADSPDAFAHTLAEASALPEAEWERLVAGVAGSPAHVLFFAERASGALGVVYGRLETEHPEIAHLGAMWVDPSARGSGVGRALVDSVLAWARARGALRVELQVTEGNANAERLYARAGFVGTEETQPLRSGSPLLARTMRVELSAR